MVTAKEEEESKPPPLRSRFVPSLYSPWSREGQQDKLSEWKMAPVYEKKERKIDTSFLFTSLFQLQLIVWHTILVFPLITSFDNMHSPHWSRPFIRSIFVTVSQFFPSLSQGVYFCIIFGGAILDPMTV